MLNRFLATARLILGCAVLVVAVAVLVEVRDLVHEARATVHNAGQDIHDSAGELHERISELKATTAAVNRVAGDVEAITASAREATPKIGKGAFDLWKHTDRTLGHLDQASNDWRDQQQKITAQSVALLESTQNQVDTIGPFLQAWTQVGGETRARLFEVRPLLVNLGDTTHNLATITGDFQTVEHNYFFPNRQVPKWQRLFNGILGTQKLAEFGYYVQGIRTGK